MEKRDGGVGKERITRDQKANDPVGCLEKASTGDDKEKLLALIERYFEQNGDRPEEQNGQKEDHYFVVFLSLCLVLVLAIDSDLRESERYQSPTELKGSFFFRLVSLDGS